MTDNALLGEYARNGSESAFAALVERHTALVYSAARRQLQDDQLAEDITQAVFIVLARQAGRLVHHPVLSAWLLKTTRYAVGTHIRAAVRRAQHEQEAGMQSTSNDSTAKAWDELAPLIDEAMAQLGDADRNVIALRFFENKTAAEIATALCLSEEAAQKRVGRAMEKLRRMVTKRGATWSVTLIAGALAVGAVRAAPLGLAAKISALAIVPGATLGISTASVVQGTLKTLAWAKYKTLLAYGTAALMTGTAVMVVLPKRPPPTPVSTAAPAKPVRSARESLVDATEITLDTPPGGLAIQPDGKIVVGTTLFGKFVDARTGTMGFYNRGALRLNPDGTLDRNFYCNVTFPGSAAQMAHLGLADDGKIFLSGLFDRVDGQPRPNFARLQADGSVDESFIPWQNNPNQPAAFFLPKPSGPTIWTVTAYQGGCFPSALLADGSVAVMCRAMENTNTPYPITTAYRLDATGAWLPPTNNILAATFRRPSGLIQTLGEVGFWARWPVDWTNDTAATPRPLLRYGSQVLSLAESRPVMDLPFDRWTDKPSAAYAAIVLRALFEEVPIELCRYAVRLPDGGAILAIRDRGNTGITAPGRFMRFDKNWQPDFRFTNQYVADLRSSLTIKRQPDGKLLVAGLVGKMDGEAFPGLVRLEENGQIDRRFHCEITNSWQGRVMDLAVQKNGKILICGFFSEVNGVEVPHLARLNPDGSLDQTFQPPLLTTEQFNRQRFTQTRHVPVVKLSAPAPHNPATTSPAPPATILVTLMRLDRTGAIIQFTGAPNQAYVLQACDALDSGTWSTVSTNHSDAQGIGRFTDRDASNHPARFYRVATP